MSDASMDEISSVTTPNDLSESDSVILNRDLLSASSNLQAGAKNYSPDLALIPGNFIECGKRIWDPAGMSNWIPVSYAREAELANGRAAMLASVGWLYPKYFGTFTGPVKTVDPILAFSKVDAQFWAQFIVLCGTIEMNKYWATNNKGKSAVHTIPSKEPFYDPFGLYGKTEAERSLMAERELKHARLAMIGIASFVSARFIEGSVPCLPPGF